MGGEGRNGFNALAYWDDPQNGGNGDGKITSEDMIWHGPINNPDFHLKLWVNSAHDGIYKPEEAHDLDYYGIVEIGVIYPTGYHKTGKKDKGGNYALWEGKVKLKDGSTLPIWDIVLAVNMDK